MLDSMYKKPEVLFEEKVVQEPEQKDATPTLNEWYPKAFSGVYGGVSLLNHLMEEEPIEEEKKSTELHKECSQVDASDGCGTHRGYTTLKEEYEKAMVFTTLKEKYALVMEEVAKAKKDYIKKKKSLRHVRFDDNAQVYEVPDEDRNGYKCDIAIYVNRQWAGKTKIKVRSVRLVGAND